jgi:hypothetical protein
MWPALFRNGIQRERKMRVRTGRFQSQMDDEARIKSCLPRGRGRNGGRAAAAAPASAAPAPALPPPAAAAAGNNDTEN